MDFGHGRRGGANQHYREGEEEEVTTSCCPQFPQPSASSSSSSSHWVPHAEAVEREQHMFEKVLTPSDVGKLNRLVIPKQHAEKHFPLGPAAANRGLELSFKDRAGKPWRFRYSYWNSSQSYVMTKGWSRFVKEKRLHAGDTVSFRRGGIGGAEPGRGCLFIDWHRRQPPPPPPTAAATFAPWGSFLPPLATGYYFSHPHVHLQVGDRDRGGWPVAVPVVMNSDPAVHGKNKYKRVRLFGVNILESEPQEDGGDVVDVDGMVQLVQIKPPPTPRQLRVGLVESTTVASPGSVLRSPH